MQRNAVNPQKRFGRQVTLRIEPELFDKLAQRAEIMTADNPGLAVSVSDVIRSTLAASFDTAPLPPRYPKSPLEKMEKYAAIGRGEATPAAVKKVRKSLPKSPPKTET